MIVCSLIRNFKGICLLWVIRPQTKILSEVSDLGLLFVVYLTTPFQYLRLHSVDIYSILIRLPSSSEAGESRVRNMAEFCRRLPIVLEGFFYMP
jgi:hypothetical protein